jgi:hypothetical protein
MAKAGKRGERGKDGKSYSGLTGNDLKKVKTALLPEVRRLVENSNFRPGSATNRNDHDSANMKLLLSDRAADREERRFMVDTMAKTQIVALQELGSMARSFPSLDPRPEKRARRAHNAEYDIAKITRKMKLVLTRAVEAGEKHLYDSKVCDDLKVLAEKTGDEDARDAIEIVFLEAKQDSERPQKDALLERFVSTLQHLPAQ